MRRKGMDKKGTIGNDEILNKGRRISVPCTAPVVGEHGGVEVLPPDGAHGLVAGPLIAAGQPPHRGHQRGSGLEL